MPIIFLPNSISSNSAMENVETQTLSKDRTGVIAGVATGFMALLLLVVVVCFVAIRNKKGSHKNNHFIGSQIHRPSSDYDSRHLHEQTVAPPLLNYVSFFIGLTLVLSFTTLGLFSILMTSRSVTLARCLCLCLLLSSVGLCVVMDSFYEKFLRWKYFRFIQPSAQLWFDGERKLSFEDTVCVMSRQSMLDQVKLWVERRVWPFRVNWYPLRQPVNPLPYGSIRVRTICVSSNLEVLFGGER